MALLDSLGRAYFEIDLDGEEKLRVNAARSDIARVLGKGQELVEKCQGIGDDESQAEGVFKEAFEVLCGDKGEEVYGLCLSYVGGGLPITECSDQMVAAIEYIVGAWTEHLDSAAARAEDLRRRYLGEPSETEDAI